MPLTTYVSWFSSPVSGDELKRLLERLGRSGFAEHENVFQDSHGRTVRVADGTATIGIPASDLVDEQEQLEFVAANLGLEVDACTRV